MLFRKIMLTILFGFLTTGVIAQSVESDYKVQKNFKKKYEQYRQKTDSVSSVAEAEKLIASIRMFDKRYSQHKELLNKALYPDRYESKMDRLKKSSVVARNRLQTIQTQARKVDKLASKVDKYQNNIAQLNRHTDSLRKAMQKSIASEKKLSSMLRDYRNSLEQRDELILSFIDSLVAAYENMDLKAVQELESVKNSSRLKSGGNALEMIHAITAENISILKNSSDKLAIEDYMRMAEVQHQFRMMWEKLGPKIQQVYQGDDVSALTSEIDNNISRWNRLLQDKTLAALQDSLVKHGIKAPVMESPSDFYQTLNSYLEKNIKKSRENPSEKGYRNFKQFSRFWNVLENSWSSNLQKAGIMEKKQLTDLNAKVDRWATYARPQTNNILVYLLGGSVLLVVALGVLLVREKKK